MWSSIVSNRKVLGILVFPSLALAGVPPSWFGRDQEGFGLEYSGFVSREVRRWGFGVFWQYYLGAAPRPVRTPDL